MTRRASAFFLFSCAFLLAGCFSLDREVPKAPKTDLGDKTVVLPVRTLDNLLIVEAKWDRDGPYHFLIDTGLSVTMVTPELAARYGEKNVKAPEGPQVRVQSFDGKIATLPSVRLSRIELGRARFSNVPALIYDCADLTGQLGVRIDGILGFPLFRRTVLTLDYPNQQVRLAPLGTAEPARGSAIAFNNSSKTPLIPIRLGDRTFIALIDSGNDETLSLNPLGLSPKYATEPTEGPTVGTLTGDRMEEVGRLSETVSIGDYSVPRSLVEITDEFSALGGGILKHFTITFDQERSQVSFERETSAPIVIPGRRSTGLSFAKTPAYWRVVGIVPGSPADGADVEPGDLAVRINGEPVAKWNVPRFEKLLAGEKEIVFTFLNGAEETSKRLKIYDLVP